MYQDLNQLASYFHSAQSSLLKPEVSDTTISSVKKKKMLYCLFKKLTLCQADA